MYFPFCCSLFDFSYYSNADEILLFSSLPSCPPSPALPPPSCIRSFFDFLQNLLHQRLTAPHHAVDEVEDSGGLPAWTEKEAALFPLVPPAVRCWRPGSVHPPAGSVRDGPATRPRSVQPARLFEGLILVPQLCHTTFQSVIHLLNFRHFPLMQSLQDGDALIQIFLIDLMDSRRNAAKGTISIFVFGFHPHAAFA